MLCGIAVREWEAEERKTYFCNNIQKSLILSDLFTFWNSKIVMKLSFFCRYFRLYSLLICTENQKKKTDVKQVSNLRRSARYKIDTDASTDQTMSSQRI